MMGPDDKIYVAGHTGMVGSALVRELRAHGFTNLLVRTRKDLDLRDWRAVEKFFSIHKPAHVLLAAAKVGGILANLTFPADFIRDNLLIESNIIHAAHIHGVKRLLFLGSSCIYPRLAPQPIREASLLAGPLETTNEAYAIAKISGIKMCMAYNKQHETSFISVMPTNLYGINDHYDAQNSHVIPAIILKIAQAKINGASKITCWGSGRARREFLYVDDLASACLLIMRSTKPPELINVGFGSDITVSELVHLVAELMDYRGDILWDSNYPDGTSAKMLDSSRVKSMGFEPRTTLVEGLKKTIADYYSRAD